MSSSFNKDLERGKYYEKKAVSILNMHGFNDLKHSEGYNPYFDIEGRKGKKKFYFEVKYDSYTANTKKIFIEISKPDNMPSGLSITKSDYYILFSYFEYWIVETEKLRELIKIYLNDKIKEEGKHTDKLEEHELFKAICDYSTCTKNSRGFIIPISYILKHSVFNGTHNEKKETKQTKQTKQTKPKIKIFKKLF